jgi:hypothetical protein
MAKIVMRVTSVTSTVDTVAASLACVEDSSPGEKEVRSYSGSIQLCYPVDSVEAKQLVPGNEFILVV